MQKFILEIEEINYVTGGQNMGDIVDKNFVNSYGGKGLLEFNPN